MTPPAGSAEEWANEAVGWLIATHPWAAGAYADVVKAIRGYAAEQVAQARADLHWLDEFVVEPEWFPNEGDRQFWQERRAAICGRR